MSDLQVQTTTPDITSTTNFPHSKGLRRGLQFGAVAVALTSAVGLWIKSNREDTARLSGDTRVIVRFPKSVFSELTQSEIHEEFPIEEQAEEMEVTGKAVANGRVSVEIQPDTICQSHDHAVIAVHVVGETEKSLVGRQSSVTVLGTGRGRFEATKRIHFDGREFRAEQETIVSATHETEIDDVETPVGGPFRLLASRKAREAVPSVNDIAIARIRERVAERIEEIVDALLPQLNAANQLNDAVSRLHPATDGWRIQVTADRNFVQAALIPAGGRLPSLPSGDESQVELWVRLTPTQRLGLRLMSLSDQSHRLLQHLIPELQARQLAEQVRIATVNDWTLLQVPAASVTKPNA